MKESIMSAIKKIFHDTTRIGEIAAQQPLSGLRIVSTVSVKGFNGPTVVKIEEKASNTDKKSA